MWLNHNIKGLVQEFREIMLRRDVPIRETAAVLLIALFLTAFDITSIFLFMLP